MGTKFNALSGNFDLVNDLGANLTDIDGLTGNKGDIIVHDGTNWVDLAVGTNGQILKAASGETEGVDWVALPDSVLNFPFAALRANSTTNFAPITYVDLGTVEDHMAAYDGAQDEYRQGTFVCPSDIDTGGTVTFEIYGKRASGTSAANVVFDFDHRAVADSEAGDGSYTTESSGALAIDTTGGDLDRLTWTETVTNLAWAANDLIIFKVGRQGADALDTLNSVDYYAWHFRILIPRV
jgi:hypothetical protein